MFFCFFLSITETISTITRPVVVPVWNHVGRPVWQTVGRPALSLISLISSIIWTIVKWPVSSAVTVGGSGLSGVTGLIGSVVSWLWNNCVKSATNNVVSMPWWLWRKTEYISKKLVVLDVWLFKR